MIGTVTKVHIVFSNKHLMGRDTVDFEYYWLLLGYDKSKVEFHVGFDNWKPVYGELLIIDEIDNIIFRDPITFSEFVDGCLVIGFTATPDDFNHVGAERNTLSLLNVKRFSYIILGEGLNLQEEEQAPTLHFDEVPSCSSVADKASLIKEYAKEGPVLVYCHEALTKALNEAGCDPFIVTEDTDAQLLRSLDVPTTREDFYRVVIAHDPFAMRGYDYRSSKRTMTLVIDRSFENFREAIQGYYRVGRFGDSCKRIRFNDVTLIDQRTSFQMAGTLVRALLQLKKKPMHVKKVTLPFSKAATNGSRMSRKRQDALLVQPGNPSVTKDKKKNGDKTQNTIDKFLKN